MPTKQNSQKFPYLASGLALIVIAILVSLGLWQLDRKYQKEQRLSSIETAATQSSVSLPQVLDDPESFLDYIVDASGEFQNKIFFIDNKLYGGRSGFHVLTPLTTNSGVVIVNLGWVPADAPRPALPQVTIPTDNSVSGILYTPKDNVLIKETNQQFGVFPVLLQQVDLGIISMHLSQPVLPFTLRMQPAQNSEFVRDWQVVVMSPEKHLGYAIQWFGLAIAALTIFLLSILKWMHGPDPSGNGPDAQ